MARPPLPDARAAVVRGHDRRAYVAATATGLLLWVGTALVSGKAEAWDAGIYWTLAYPLALVASIALGYRFPRRAWRWPLVLMLAQAVALAVSASELDLLPLGLLMFAVLALPGVALALLAARRRQRVRI